MRVLEVDCLQAAQFGKTFADGFNPDNFVRMCRVLRVINAVRDPKIGILLTYPQYPLNVKPMYDLFGCDITFGN